MNDDRRLMSAAAEKEPGLIPDGGDGPSASANPYCDGSSHCVTCSDEVLVARVLRIDDEVGLALVTVQDVTVEVDVTLVDEVRTGQLLLVHGGVAIAHQED